MTLSVECVRCGKPAEAATFVSVPVWLVTLPVNGVERGPYCADCLGHIKLLGVAALAALGVVALVLFGIYV